ncbi:phosphosulfolactate synthase [Paenibacillus sp. HB172176]|uniref:phosphosulfolactate synthase n=1 Tax=Paenibacillus sp. HB172176 TaxID=2493690 RepID=UPI00143B644E|nr:phosphosulfolactate synthase [Paenibacillus sp. HB172176]
MRTADISIWHKQLMDPSGRRIADRHNRLGKTMVIDKGMGLSAFRDFLDVSGQYADMIKLGFGTAVLYPPELLRGKLEAASEKGIIILPGGTLLEAAIAQQAVSSFLDTICELGFSGLEVSDGTIELDRKRRTALINEGVKRGLYVMTEYGKKAAGSAIDPDELAFTAECDFDAGAELVTIEARESGIDIGLFDEQGRCKEDVLHEVLEKVGSCGRIMWEAPLKSQQAELLNQFGPSVHLGNVAPADALALEAMRRGLRSDTFDFGNREEMIDYMI